MTGGKISYGTRRPGKRGDVNHLRLLELSWEDVAEAAKISSNDVSVSFSASWTWNDSRSKLRSFIDE